MANLAVAVSRTKITEVRGTFQRHTGPHVTSVVGSPAGGRWGRPGALPVLYLGRPTDAVVGEAYRHLVDDIEGMTGDTVGPRTLWTLQVAVTGVVDLRDPASLAAVGLTAGDLHGDIDKYDRCQAVAQAAHQLQLHGIIAPSATGIGETVALFDHWLPVAEVPTVVHRETWEQLPADPRRLRVVRTREAGNYC